VEGWEQAFSRKACRQKELRSRCSLASNTEVSEPDIRDKIHGGIAGSDKWRGGNRNQLDSRFPLEVSEPDIRDKIHGGIAGSDYGKEILQEGMAPHKD